MNLFKKSLYLCTTLFAGATFFTSCDIDSEDSTASLYVASCFGTVIEGDKTTTLELDNGYWMEFDKSTLTLTDTKRIYIEYYFYESHLVKDGEKTYVDPYDYVIYKASVETVYNETEAAENHIADADSIFSFSSYQCTMHDGYLSALITSPYVSSILPSAHLYFNNADMTADTATVHLVVNRHSTGSTSGNVKLINSFEMNKVAEQYAGKDSIVLAIQSAATTSPVYGKFAISDLKVAKAEE